MPATLAVRPATTLLTNVNIFGEADSYNRAPRVRVARTVHLSFAEILGMLAYPGGLTWEELQDESEVLRSVLYSLVDSTGEEIRQNAVRAMADLGGLTDNPESTRYAAHLAMVVTRVFGITLPTVPDASVSLRHVRSDVDINGERCRFNGAPRIALSAPLWLTFGELLGLLALSPDSGLVYEELDEDDALFTYLWIGLNDATWDDVEESAVRALGVLAGRVPDESAEFVTAAAPAVTRAFGIAA